MSHLKLQRIKLKENQLFCLRIHFVCLSVQLVCRLW